MRARHLIAAILTAALTTTALIAGGARPARAQTPRFVTAPVYSSGGLASAVFGGGSVADLEAAARGAGAAGVWAQTGTGGDVLLVVGGPTFVNEAFRAGFPAGFATPAAVTLTRAEGAPAPAAISTPAAAPATTPPATSSTPAPAATAAVGSWKTAEAPASAQPAGGEWIAIAASEGRTVLAKVLRPAGTGPFPAIVLLHSQNGFSNDYLALGEEIARSGFVTVVGCWFGGNYDGTAAVDLPPRATVPGGIDCPDGPALKSIVSPQAVEDVKAIVTATKTLPGVRADRVGLVGNSRGSIVGVLTGASAGGSLQAVVAIGGAPIGGPLLAPTLTAPLLLLQGEMDSVVPVVNARSLEAALLALGRTVESHYYPGGHGILFDTPFHAEAMSRTTAFLRAQLAK